MNASLCQQGEHDADPRSPRCYAIEHAARLIALQLLTDAITALEHP